MESEGGSAIHTDPKPPKTEGLTSLDLPPDHVLEDSAFRNKPSFKIDDSSVVLTKSSSDSSVSLKAINATNITRDKV